MKIPVFLLILFLPVFCLSQPNNLKTAKQYFLKANQYYEQRDYEQSIKYCDLSLKYYKIPDAYLIRGRDNEFLGRNTEALNDFNICINISPKKADFYLDRGQLKSNPNVGDYIGAIQDYNKGIELDHKSWNLFYSRGCAKEDLTDDIGAMLDFNQSIFI